MYLLLVLLLAQVFCCLYGKTILISFFIFSYFLLNVNLLLFSIVVNLKTGSNIFRFAMLISFLFLNGLILLFTNIILSANFQKTVPNELRARIDSFRMIINQFSGMLSIFIGGFLLDILNSLEIVLPGFVRISTINQIPLWQKGTLREHVCDSKINEARFRKMLGSFDIIGESFDKNMEEFSSGELKKIELLRSIMDPVMLLLWDEPLNYLDIPTRLKIEESVLFFKPTIMFIEHDKYFIEKVTSKKFFLLSKLYR